jgi:acyl-CoA thioester hydrolase
VTLEETIRYHRELRAGDALTVSCEFVWGEGKTFRLQQEIRLADATVLGELTAVCGLMDLQTRRLVPDPARRRRTLTHRAGFDRPRQPVEGL